MKRIVFLASLWLFQIPLYAQTLTWNSASRFGGTSGENLTDITFDNVGNMYVTGGYSSPSMNFGSTTLSVSTANDYFLVKFNSSGIVQWARTATCSSIGASETGHSVVTDVSGNVYVAGIFTGPTMNFGTTTLNNTGTNALFIAKYDASGNLMWTNAQSGISSVSMTLGVGGDLFLSGTFSGTVNFGSSSLTSSGGLDMYVAKYSSAGILQSATSFGGASNDQPRDIATDPNGDICVAGSFNSGTFVMGSTTLTNTGSSDGFVARLSSSLVPIWAVPVTGSSSNLINAIVIDQTGNVYSTGYSLTNSATIGSYTVPAGMFLAKYSPTGTVQWATGPGEGIGYSIIIDNSNNLYVAGDFSSATVAIGPDNFTNSGGNDILVAKYNNAGIALGGVSASGIGNETARIIALNTTTGDIHAGGNYASNPLILGTASLNNASMGSPLPTDIFIAKLTQCISAPAQPGAINGISAVCSGSLQTYSTAAVAGASSYTWTLPSGWTGTSTTNSITATAGATGGNITVAAVSACGTSNTQSLAVTSSPGPTATITAAGVTTFCQGGSVVLSAPTGTGFTYQWKLNASDIAGATSSSYSANASGAYTVSVSNGSCSSVSVATTVTVNALPVQPGLISGAASACVGSSQTYSITSVAGATSYTWTLPSGWTGTSTTNSITATVGTTGGNITVAAVNACGTSTTQTLPVTVSPGPSATITAAGATTFCQGGSVVLNAPAGTGYTYQWKVNGNDITGATNASYTANAAGAYTVVVSNSSCSSTSAATTITVNPLPTPSIIQTGMVLSTAAGQGTYQWYKNAAIILGATSNSYTVIQNGAYYVMVTNSNNCTGQSNSINITNVSVKGPKKRELSVYPTTNNGSFIIQLPQASQPSTLRIVSIQGQTVKKEFLQQEACKVRVNITPKVPGLYLVELVYPEAIYYEKIIIE